MFSLVLVITQLPTYQSPYSQGTIHIRTVVRDLLELNNSESTLASPQVAWRSRSPKIYIPRAKLSSSVKQQQSEQSRGGSVRSSSKSHVCAEKGLYTTSVKILPILSERSQSSYHMHTMETQQVSVCNKKEKSLYYL